MKKTAKYVLTEKGAEILRKRGADIQAGDPYTRNVQTIALRSYLRNGYIVEVEPVKPTIYSKLSEAEQTVLFAAIDAYYEEENASRVRERFAAVDGMLSLLVATRKMTPEQAMQCREQIEEHRAEWLG